MSKLSNVSLGLVLATGLVLGLVLPGEARANGPRDVTGTWEFQLNFVNCETGDVLAGPFRGLHSYHRGGTLSEVGFSPGPPPSAWRSVGLGTWRQAGGRMFESTFVFFSFDAGGVPLRSVEVEESVEVARSGDTLTAVAVARVADSGGNELAVNCLAGTAERVSLP